MPFRRKPHTLRRRLVLPLLFIVLVQAVLYSFVFVHMNVTTKIDNNAYDIFAQHASSRSLDLESQMLHRWGNLDQASALVCQSLQETLAAQGCTPRDLLADASRAQQAVAAAAPEVLYLLRANGVTGAFLVLDAPGLTADKTGKTRAGLYVRDLDPAAYAADNGDLLLERAMPAASKALHLPLSSYWSSVFEFTGDGSTAEDFFMKPLHAAQQHADKTPAQLGYWSPLFALPDDRCNVITYSQPLVAEDGTVLGVLGIDLTETYLRSKLPHVELGLGRDASYMLATAQSDALLPMLASSSGYHLAAGSPLPLAQTKRASIYEVRGAANPQVVAVMPLKIYDSDSPFAGEQWVLSSIAPQNKLLSFSQDMRNATYLSLLLSLLCAIGALILMGHLVTKPITQLAHDLSASDPSQPVTLPKLHIREIDELSDAIEDLSSSVAASASKFSEIIRRTNVPIGVYEYTASAPTVFCSGTMCRMLCWTERDDLDRAVPIFEFGSRMRKLETYRCADDYERLYRMRLDSEHWRWVRLTELPIGDGFIGSVVDITHEMLDRKKIEYERDYDVLSHLYNRRAFDRRLHELFAAPEALGCAALVMWDLDNLKYLNDTYGHDCGDEYIVAFAAVLGEDTPRSCVTSRRSGDEFYAFFYGYETQDALRADISALYEKIGSSSLQLPTGNPYRMRASGGVAFYPQDSTCCETLIQYADFAMYSVKHASKGNIEEFNHARYLQNSVLLRGQDALDSLLDHKQVRYALQPIVDVHACRIFGYEMLMRPQSPELPNVSDVLRLARIHSKLHLIERLTLFQGMEAFAQLEQDGKLAPNAKVFVNSVASQLLPAAEETQFLAQFAPYLSRMVLEITENDPYDTDATQHKIALIRAHGGEIALDDFGSGFNGESILLFVAPDYVKLDLSIIRNIDQDSSRQGVLAYLVSYAKPRGIRVLAEGVETIEELQYVVTHGVDLLQGYYLAKPAFTPEPIAPQILDVIRDAARRAVP